MSAWILTLAPVVGLALDVLVQIGVAHGSQRIARSIVIGAGAGLAVTAAIAISMLSVPSFGDRLAGFALAILTYLALAFGFWTFLNLNITSLRIRMLREIRNRGNAIACSELFMRYSAHEFLSRRLERLVTIKQLRHVDGNWTLESYTYLYLARFLNGVRAAILPSRERRVDDT